MPTPKFNSATAAPQNKTLNTAPAPTNPMVAGTTGGTTSSQNKAGLVPGIYKFTIKTVDKFGGVTYHNCHVKVVPSTNTTTAATEALSTQMGNLNSGNYERAFGEMLGQSDAI